MNPALLLLATTIVQAIVTDLQTFGAELKHCPDAQFRWKPLLTKIAIGVLIALLASGLADNAGQDVFVDQAVMARDVKR